MTMSNRAMFQKSIDFSKISDEKPKNAEKEKLAKFINHSGKSADGTPISDIVREELGRKAVQKHQVKEIQAQAVNEYSENQDKFSDEKEISDVECGSMDIPVYIIATKDLKQTKQLKIKGIGLLV